MLEAIGLGKRFTRGIWRRPVLAVRDISFQVNRGEAVGLVGFSGSGKSTVARMLTQIIPPTSGTVRLDNVDLAQLPPAKKRPYRLKIQMIFQDPHLALDPKRTIGWSMREVLLANEAATSCRQADEQINALFAEVGLSPEILKRLPREISGGQAQRVVIARALSLSPEYLIADEPTSMLDLSVQAMIFNLLKALQRRRHLGIVLISHDPTVVHAFCDRVLAIQDGALLPETIRPSEFLYPPSPHNQLPSSASKGILQ